MAFSTRRGRPKSPSRHEGDMGTPELCLKRALGVTQEVLDLCLERGIIDNAQHWSGIHFRWLYTLRFGVPTVRAVDPTDLGGALHKLEDPTWRAEREEEYALACTLLNKAGLREAITDICVHNYRPGFLQPPRGAISRAMMLARTAEQERMSDGLDMLAIHWGRKKRN